MCGLSPEILAVLRSSAHLNPCPKFRKANIYKFMEHLNEGKCRQCIEFFLRLEKDQEMMQFLRESSN